MVLSELYRRSAKMFWRTFTTKAALEADIREDINSRVFGCEFESVLLSDLISERHYFCSRHKIRPSRFRKEPNKKNYILFGFFDISREGRQIGWHPASWIKCVKRPPNDWDLIIEAMRRRIEPRMQEYRRMTPTCEDCHSAPSEEVHHSVLSFSEVTTRVRDSISDHDISFCMKDWDWFSSDDFALPEWGAVTEMFELVHDFSVPRALCKCCHNKTKKS